MHYNNITVTVQAGDSGHTECIALYSRFSKQTRQFQHISSYLVLSVNEVHPYMHNNIALIILSGKHECMCTIAN